MAQTKKDKLIEALDKVVAAYRDTPDDVLLARLETYTEEDYGIFLGLLQPSVASLEHELLQRRTQYSLVELLEKLEAVEFLFAANDYDYALAA